MTSAGITSLLHNLDVHKASGPDEISTRLLKETEEFKIFEKLLGTGDIPFDWRVANVAPIYNKINQSPKTIVQSRSHLQSAKF